MAAVNWPCVQNLRGSTDSPESPIASPCHALRGKGRWHLRQQMTEGISGKFQGAPEFATFASPQALRANSTFIQRGAFDASEILNALTYCRKNPGKQRRFSGRVKEVRRENEIPPGSRQLTAAAGNPGRRDFCICCLDQIAIDLRIFCKKFCIFCHACLRAA